MKKIELSILFLLFATACTSSYYLIEPNEEYELYGGRKIIHAEHDSLLLSLNFEGYNNGEIFFFLYAENSGGKEVLIDPQKIEMTILEAEEFEYAGKELSAIDPEEQLAELNAKEALLDESYETASGLNCLFASFSVIASIADDSEETDPINETGYWLEEMNEDHERYKYAKESLSSAREFWRNEVFRITTLQKGDSYGGLLVFQMIKAARMFVIAIQVGELKFKYYFRQSEVERK